MVALPNVATRSETAPVSDSIETLRATAIVLLVSYHAIGPDLQGGLNIAYPHMLRLFADFFADLRMPLFAFIAGYVYAFRPPEVTRFGLFLIGKLRRLYIPCGVAALAFALTANLIGNKFALPLGEMWQVLFTSYAHFWFLQSLLVILFCYGLFDALARHRFSVAVLLGSLAVYLSPFVFNTSVASLNGAIYLLPFFMLGVVTNRHGAEIWSETDRLSLVLLCVAIACALWNIRILYETDSFSNARRDVQSLGFGVSMCVLLYLYAPRLPILERLSPYGLTIYLYHIFGTVLARKACEAIGEVPVELQFVCCTCAGLGLPVLLFCAASKVPLLCLIVLGQAPKRVAPSPRLGLERTFLTRTS